MTLYGLIKTLPCACLGQAVPCREARGICIVGATVTTATFPFPQPYHKTSLESWYAVATQL